MRQIQRVPAGETGAAATSHGCRLAGRTSPHLWPRVWAGFSTRRPPGRWRCRCEPRNLSPNSRYLVWGVGWLEPALVDDEQQVDLACHHGSPTRSRTETLTTMKGPFFVSFFSCYALLYSTLPWLQVSHCFASLMLQLRNCPMLCKMLAKSSVFVLENFP